MSISTRSEVQRIILMHNTQVDWIWWTWHPLMNSNFESLLCHILCVRVFYACHFAIILPHNCKAFPQTFLSNKNRHNLNSDR
jgi:hypothetical protein